MSRNSKQTAVGRLIGGMFAGAAGTAALNALTCADTAVRGLSGIGIAVGALYGDGRAVLGRPVYGAVTAGALELAGRPS